MSFEDNQLKISQILANKFIVEHNNKLFFFSEPTEEDFIIADIFYHKTYQELLDSGSFLTEAQAKQLAIDHRIWDDESESTYNQLLSNLNKLTKERPKYKFREAHLKSVDNAIAVTKSEIDKLYKLKCTFVDQTIEYQATLLKNFWLLVKLLRDVDNNLIWNTYEDFENDSNYGDTIGLVNILFYRGILTAKEVRAIAKSEPWRTMWRVSLKGGSTIFKNGFLTNMQFFLSHWSLMYDYGRESMDSPPNSVFEDDDLFDEWLESQSSKLDNDAENKHSKSNFNVTNNAKIANAQEIFVPVDSAQDAQKVYNELNSNTSRTIIRKRMDFLEKHGRVKESEMPDTKQDLMLQRQQMFSQAVKGNR